MTPRSEETAGGPNDPSTDELRRFLGLLIRLLAELGVSYPLFEALTNEVREGLARDDASSGHPSCLGQSKLPSPGPRSVAPELRTVVIASLADLTSTQLHNVTQADAENGLCQRAVFTDRFPKHEVPALRSFVRKQTVAFTETLDDHLAERETGTDAPDPESDARVGVGIYYFEQASES